MSGICPAGKREVKMEYIICHGCVRHTPNRENHALEVNAYRVHVIPPGSAGRRMNGVHEAARHLREARENLQREAEVRAATRRADHHRRPRAATRREERHRRLRAATHQVVEERLEYHDHPHRQDQCRVYQLREEELRLAVAAVHTAAAAVARLVEARQGVAVVRLAEVVVEAVHLAVVVAAVRLEAVVAVVRLAAVEVEADNSN